MPSNRGQILAAIRQAKVPESKGESLADALMAAFQTLEAPTVEIESTDVGPIVEALKALRADIVSGNAKVQAAIEKSVTEAQKGSSEVVKALGMLSDSIKSLDMSPSFDVNMPNAPKALEVERDDFGKIIGVRVADA